MALESEKIDITAAEAAVERAKAAMKEDQTPEQVAAIQASLQKALELGVYPKHVPLLTTLKPGELRVVKSGRETTMAIGEGFVEIKGDAVSVLTDMALESEKIDIATAEAAVERAKAAMKEDHSAEEVAAIQASLQKALAQLQVKRRRHHG